MLFLIIFTYFLLFNVSANKKSQFIYDYFNHKKIASVVGFSCNSIRDDVLLMKKFSDSSIAATLNKFHGNLSIAEIARSDYRTLGIFVDIDCFEAKAIVKVFSQAANAWLFDELHIWLVLSTSFERASQVINDKSFGLSTDFVIACVFDNADYELYDLYNICREHGGQLNVTFFGKWNTISGMNVALKQSKFLRRNNLHGIVFKSMYLELKGKLLDESVDTYLQVYSQPIVEGQNKYGYIILKHLSELHNFSIISQSAVDPKFGEKFGPTALALVERRADFTGTPLAINNLRLYHIKYIHQSWPFRTCFIFRNPQPKIVKYYEIFQPLAEDSWYSFVFVLVTGVIILATLIHFEKNDTTDLAVSDSLLINIGTMCQQGTTEEMDHISTRTAFFFLMIFSLLFYNYYCSSIVSVRLDGQIYKINDSLHELGKLNLKMASDRIDYLKLLLRYPDWETKTFNEKYWSKIPESEWFVDQEVAIPMVKQGGFAYHTLPDDGYQLIEKSFSNTEICELMEVHLSRPKFTAFAVRYNSTIVEMARVGLTKISEVGIGRRQVIRWQNRKPICLADVLSASSINIYEFAPHLILMLIGMILAAVGCILEVYLYNKGEDLKLRIQSFKKRVILREITVYY